MSFVGSLSYVGVAVVGGWLAINGKIRIGDIQAIIQYMNQFTQPIMPGQKVAIVGPSRKNDIGQPANTFL